MFYTYILKSLKDKRRYIGHTDDIEQRLVWHNAGFNPSTKHRRPLELLCYKKFETRKEAMEYERYLKSLKGGKQLDIEIQKMLNEMDKNKNVDAAQPVPHKCGTDGSK